MLYNASNEMQMFETRSKQINHKITSISFLVTCFCDRAKKAMYSWLVLQKLN